VAVMGKIPGIVLVKAGIVTTLVSPTRGEHLHLRRLRTASSAVRTSNT
jgi:hypothetical protein